VTSEVLKDEVIVTGPDRIPAHQFNRPYEKALSPLERQPEALRSWNRADRRGPGILFSIAALSYNTLLAKARYSSIKPTWTSSPKQAMWIHQQYGGMGFLADSWTAPPSIMGTGLLETWPQITCPGWYFKLGHGALLVSMMSASLFADRDDTPYWSYCVNTFGGGNCNGPDMYTINRPSKSPRLTSTISTAPNNR